jgi:hypothetical protein
MATAPVNPTPVPNPQLGDSQKETYAFQIFDTDKQPVTPQTGDTITVVSSAPASIAVTPDTSAAAGSVASGFLVGGAPALGVTVTATYTPISGASPIVVVDTIDVVAGAAATGTLTLGAPVSQ